MKTLVALIISSILLAPIANADDRCDTCNPGGGSVGDGYVFKPYRCPNDFGRMTAWRVSGLAKGDWP
jgi:hypothetical protein